MGRFASPGCREILQSCFPEASYHLVRTGMPCWLRTITASCMKVTVQSASQGGPTPIKVWRETGIRCPVIGNPDGRWGKKSPLFQYIVGFAPLQCRP